jgi:hypothetical protein
MRISRLHPGREVEALNLKCLPKPIDLHLVGHHCCALLSSLKALVYRSQIVELKTMPLENLHERIIAEYPFEPVAAEIVRCPVLNS